MLVGLVGAGRIGAFHAETLTGHPEVEELLVADADASRSRALADKLSATAAESVDEVFTGNLDAVVITAATSAHARLIDRAIDTGLPVFCEKPIAANLAGTLDVLARVRASGARLQVGFQRRFDRGYRGARAALAAGELGTLYTVRMTGADPSPPHPSYVPTSGGMFRDMHIHDFDALRWMTGHEVVEVFAAGANRGEDFFREAGDVDTSAGLLRLDDGTLATVTGSRYNGAGYDIRMELAGSQSTLVVGLDNRAALRSAEPDVDFPAERPYTGFLDRFAVAYVAEMHAFVDFARGVSENPCVGEDALAALYIAESCELSRREGRPVRVEEVRKAR